MSTSKQETQRQTILQLWNKGIHNGQEIYRCTNIPLSTIYDNIKKFKKNRTVDHARGNGGPKRLPEIPQERWDNLYDEMLQFQQECWLTKCFKLA